jgi:hypothetical protein
VKKTEHRGKRLHFCSRVVINTEHRAKDYLYLTESIDIDRALELFFEQKKVLGSYKRKERG